MKKRSGIKGDQIRRKGGLWLNRRSKILLKLDNAEVNMKAQHQGPVAKSSEGAD